MLRMMLKVMLMLRLIVMVYDGVDYGDDADADDNHRDDDHDFTEFQGF